MDNNIKIKRRSDGIIDYIADLGQILYNDRVINISNLIIPLHDQTFFTLPEDKDKYAAVNVYYDPASGKFIYDMVRKSDNFFERVISDAIPNVIPISQFIIVQKINNFQVVRVNEYSKRSTFSITTEYTQGVRGLQGHRGYTGYEGATGIIGVTGCGGLMGETGPQGYTGVGSQGETGPKGETGYADDKDLLLRISYEVDDNEQPDYSVYDRDFGWTAQATGMEFIGFTGLPYEGLFYTGIVDYPVTGSGYTGSGFTGISYTGVGLTGGSFTGQYTGGITGLDSMVTGIIYSPFSDPEHVQVEGPEGHGRFIKSNKGSCSFVNGSYIPFGFYTGVLQVWMQLDHAPVPDFEYEADPVNPLKINFTDTTLLLPISWSWDFGDGVTNDIKNPVHTYPSSGDYIVTLTVTNASGSTKITKVVTV